VAQGERRKTAAAAAAAANEHSSGVMTFKSQASVSQAASGLERREPSAKLEAHLLPNANLPIIDDVVASEGGNARVVEVEFLTGGGSGGGGGGSGGAGAGGGGGGMGTHRYQNDPSTARTHAFDELLNRASERLAERFGLPAIDSPHCHGERLYCVARVCVKENNGSIDELGIYLQNTVGSGQPRMRYFRFVPWIIQCRLLFFLLWS